jgi:hypothetical protein
LPKGPSGIDLYQRGMIDPRHLTRESKKRKIIATLGEHSWL